MHSLRALALTSGVNAMDVLAVMVNSSIQFLNDEIGEQEYRSRMVELMRDANANDLKALADVITTNAIHLRAKGH